MEYENRSQDHGKTSRGRGKRESGGPGFPYGAVALVVVVLIGIGAGWLVMKGDLPGKLGIGGGAGSSQSVQTGGVSSSLPAGSDEATSTGGMTGSGSASASMPDGSSSSGSSSAGSSSEEDPEGVGTFVFPPEDWDGSESEEDFDIEEYLQQFARAVPKAKPLAEHPEDYPEKLLVAAMINQETLDFVLGYPEHKDDKAVDRVEEAEKGKMTLIMQWDPRWGYVEYGSGPIGVTGCGPTCLAMVVHCLTGRSEVTPAVISKMAEESGMWAPGAGSTWDLMRIGCKNYGLEAKELPLDKGVMENALNAGKPIILSVGPGDFTLAGHFIVVAGVEDGKFRICDPYRHSTSDRLWSYDEIKDQIRNIWCYTVA